MSSERPHSRPRPVLVVDDDPVVRMMASRCLRAMGLDVAEAEDGLAAIEQMQETVPDLVLLDVEMPGIDGFETCRELRRLLPDRELAILIATGHTDKATIDRAFEVGASDFVSKPLDWALLQHRVRFLLRAHRAFAELRNTLGDLRASEQRLENAQRLARIGDWEWDVGDSEMLWSEQVYRTLGITPGPGVSTLAAFFDAVHAEDRVAVEKALQKVACEARGVSLDHRVVAVGGEERFVRQEIEVRCGASGAAERLRGTIQDVSAVRRAEDRIRYLASFDALTALPNRRLLMEHLERSIGHARRRGQMLALLYVDLDRFGRINEMFDHQTGDRVLQALSERLLSCVRSTDFVGRSEPGGPVLSRLGGDEFTIVMRELRSGDDASRAARRLLEVMRQPLAALGAEVTLTAGIGISLFPFDGDTAAVLLRNAEAAADEAKTRGSGAWQFYRQEMNESSGRALRIETLLGPAIERGELSLAYQPQIEIESGRIATAEALLRWPGCELGAIGPSEFVHVAEQCGLIVQLGAWVLRDACRQIRAWRASGDPVPRIAVNVSTRQLHDPDFATTVRTTLEREGVEPNELEFEITESALLVEDPGLIATLSTLRALGISIALDDFGTGYSSLSHLARLPIDVIKIDQSFVAELEAEGRGAAIVAAVVALGRRLSLSVTAEGVETDAQCATLAALGCDVLQGFRLAPALDPAAFAAFMRARC